MDYKKDNKLIVDFLGWRKSGCGEDYYIPDGFELIKQVETTVESNWCEILEEQDTCKLNEMKFLTSWDWLMPTIEKIEGLGYDVRVRKDDCIIYYNTDKSDRVVLYCEHVKGKLLSTYSAIVEFIKRYNSDGEYFFRGYKTLK